jgi:hypothetical protein
MEKKLRPKISCQGPFKQFTQFQNIQNTKGDILIQANQSADSSNLGTSRILRATVNCEDRLKALT